MFFKLVKYSVAGILAFALLAILAFGVLFLVITPNLPSIEGLSDIRLQVPLRIYSSDGSLLGVFGEKRRTPKSIDDIPLLMKQAFLAAEDDRFFEHPGVDYQGILRATLHLIRTGERGQGGSTITMQLARNFYLSREKTYTRKISEIFLSLKMESELSKKKILELYLNKIYLGNRSYGVAAAARTYYGAKLNQLNLAQIAMIAGLPKAPSRYNPIINPERAITRRNYVLSRLLQLGNIDQVTYDQTIEELVTAKRFYSQIAVEAPYVNEMVRAEIVKQFGDDAYSRGLKVYTTIKDKLQMATNDSLWNGLVAYDHRHGFRGVKRHINLDELAIDVENPEAEAVLDVPELLKNDISNGRFRPALVTGITELNEQESISAFATVVDRRGEEIVIPWEGIEWARQHQSVNRLGKKLKAISDVLKRGDVVWITQKNSGQNTGQYILGQIPEVQGALVAIAPNDGAIRGLTGGLNFSRSKFNRAVQAKRQAGSSFKPIIYSAALAKKYTPASIINDAPVVFEDKALEGAWRPENYGGKFYGPTRLRMALYKSRNLVSIRILQDIGVGYATRFASKFGLNTEALPKDLSLSLGSSELSPLELARAYATFANGGYLVKPYVISRIEDADGAVLFEADPEIACVSCVLARRRVITDVPSDKVEEEEELAKLPKQAAQTLEPRLAYQMNSILRDVIKRGTGRRALALGRKDLAGKTGTTNDQRDAWFNGFHPDLVAIAWVGFDHLKPLGNRETGSSTALPIWVDFMRRALNGVPEKFLQQPEGLVSVKINADTGEAATDVDKNTVFELFRSERSPAANKTSQTTGSDSGNTDKGAPTPEQLF